VWDTHTERNTRTHTHTHRVSSPLWGCSILMTSAPRSASSCVAQGPGDRPTPPFQPVGRYGNPNSHGEATQPRRLPARTRDRSSTRRCASAPAPLVVAAIFAVCVPRGIGQLGLGSLTVHVHTRCCRHRGRARMHRHAGSNTDARAPKKKRHPRRVCYDPAARRERPGGDLLMGCRRSRTRSGYRERGADAARRRRWTSTEVSLTGDAPPGPDAGASPRRRP
jgi:hypothetical protein